MNEVPSLHPDGVKVPCEGELIFHLSKMVDCEVVGGLAAILTGEPPLPDIAGCLSVWPKRKALEHEIATMQSIMGMAKNAFEALADAQDQWDEFDRFAPELEPPTDARRRVGNLPMALGVSQTAAIANLRLYQTCKARLEGLEDQSQYHPRVLAVHLTTFGPIKSQKNLRSFMHAIPGACRTRHLSTLAISHQGSMQSRSMRFWGCAVWTSRISKVRRNAE